MEIVGNILKSLPSRKIQGKKGESLIRSFVIETPTQYPQKLVFEVWDDKGDILKMLKKGDEVKIQFDITGREYNDKYYVTLKAFKIESEGHTSAPAKARTATSPHRQPERAETERSRENDDDQGDLPF